MCEIEIVKFCEKCDNNQVFMQSGSGKKESCGGCLEREFANIKEEKMRAGLLEQTPQRQSEEKHFCIGCGEGIKEPISAEEEGGELYNLYECKNCDTPFIVRTGEKVEEMVEDINEQLR